MAPRYLWSTAFADDDRRRLVDSHEGAVGEVGPGRGEDASAMGPAHDPLAVQLPIHQPRRRDTDLEPLGPSEPVRVVAVAATFRARTMSSGKGDGLVMEVEVGVVMRLPLLMPAAAGLERAGDPEVARVKADDLPARMNDAAVPRPGAAERDRLDVAHRRDAVAGGSMFDHARTVLRYLPRV